MIPVHKFGASKKPVIEKHRAFRMVREIVSTFLCWTVEILIFRIIYIGMNEPSIVKIEPMFGPMRGEPENHPLTSNRLS